MRCVRAIGAFLMLALFLCLGAESFTAAQEAPHVDHADGGVVSLEASSAPLAQESGSCADPCHYGCAHLGHCLAFFPTLSILKPSLPSALRWNEESARILSPSLAGFRRPPRPLA